MLLTRKSEYALLALVSIAKNNTPTNVDQLSEDLDISKSFLAKILQNLAKGGILNSYKGSRGGFVLNKDCSKLTILEIITVAESKTPSVFECTTQFTPCARGNNKKCTIFPLLSNLQMKINNFLGELTLQDILPKNNI